MAWCISLGSANLKGSAGFGKKEDYTYDVPEGAIHVSLDAEDKSSNSLNIGSGNGKVTLEWDREEKKARVHAWVNGAAGSPNEVKWTVYAWIHPYPHKLKKPTAVSVTIPDGMTFTVDSDLNGTSPQFTLTCISTGGPATNVTWTRDSVTVSEGTKTVLDDPVTSQYTHTLTVTGSLGGLYRCTVGPTTSVQLTVQAPSPPFGMTVSQNGVDSVQVSWTPPSGKPAVTGYIIYYQQQDGGHSASEMAGATATTTTITGLMTGATYSITMVATSSTLPSTVTAAETITIEEVPEQKFYLAEKRGLAILITCDYRGTPEFPSLPGTEKDAKEMKDTFERFKYDIHQLQNEQATLSNIEGLLKQIGKYFQHYNGAAKNHDGSTKVIIFAFSGHGSNPNLLITNDGQPLFLKDVMKPLVNPKLLLVHDIPKLFMIDACRGSGELSTSDDGVGAVPGNYRLDFATIRDHKAIADDDESVWMPVLARDLRKPMFKDKSYQGLVANVNRDVYKKYDEHPQSQDQLIVGELKIYYQAA